MNNAIDISILRFTEINKIQLFRIAENERDILNLPTVTAFINGDIQTVETCEYILEILKSVKLGKVNYDKFSGNGCTIEIRENITKVINNFCENDISEIDTDELIRIMNIWLENKKKFDKSYEEKYGIAEESEYAGEDGEINRRNKKGVYEKKCCPDKNREKTDYIRTYFPINLSQQEVVDMINEAYENKIKVPETKNLYLGITNEGMFIYMYLNEDEKIENAFPLYEKYPIPKGKNRKYKYFETKDYFRENECTDVYIRVIEEDNIGFLFLFMHMAVRDKEDEENYLNKINKAIKEKDALETGLNDMVLSLILQNGKYIIVITDYIMQGYLEETEEREIKEEEYSSTIEVEYFKKFMRLQVELKEKFNETGDIY